MKLSCSIHVGNRQLATLSVPAKHKHVKSTLALCKQPKSEEYCIILFNSQNKTGTKYAIKGNISQILTRFINDGKATIQFKAPPHDLYVQSDVIQLKSFLNLLKKVLVNQITPREIKCCSVTVTPIAAKDVAPTKLVIKNRSDYPRGFPRTLEALYINNIKRCGLDKGILQLTKLKILDLSCNCIEFLPNELNTLHLKDLNLASNVLNKSTAKQWTWMSGNLSKSLVSLNLQSNNLNVVSEQIIKLRALENLNISENKVKFLPKGIGSLRNLKVLNASKNLLSVLPGSMKKCQLQLLNLFQNDLLDIHSQNLASFPVPRNLQVFSLKEHAARKVLDCKFSYSPATVPLTLVSYLDNANYCVCGKACLEIFIRASETISSFNIAHELVASRNMLALDCYFCSVDCYRNSQAARTRHPVT